MKTFLGLVSVLLFALFLFLFSGCAAVEPEPEARRETVHERVIEEPEPESEPEPTPPEVSEELYDRTFSAVEEMITEFNRIIANRDFGAWKGHLTERYIRTYSDPDVLEQSSQSSVLVRNNIVLRDLQDYFTYVVVPSRANARLDDLVFVSEDTVEAIMVINERRYVLYLLKNVDDRWKIDTF